MMRYIFVLVLFLTACQFHPLYSKQTTEGVCVSKIPDENGYYLYNQLKNYFPDTTNCHYTLQVNNPKFSLSDQSISDKDFITMQRITVSTNFSLLNNKKKVVLKNKVTTDGSSAVVQNPYSTVVSVDKTEQNLIPILAEQIALHVTAYLDRDHK